MLWMLAERLPSLCQGWMVLVVLAAILGGTRRGKR